MEARYKEGSHTSDFHIVTVRAASVCGHDAAHFTWFVGQALLLSLAPAYHPSRTGTGSDGCCQGRADDPYRKSNKRY